jgi:hypothetical protein
MIVWILTMCFHVFFEQLRTAKIIVIEKQKKRRLGTVNAVIPRGGKPSVDLICITERETSLKRLYDFPCIVY